MQNKRESGTGSFRVKPNGSIEYRICIDSVQRSFSGKTESEARRKCRDFQKNNKVWSFVPTKTTVEEYISNWLLLYKYRKVADSTYDRLEQTFERHILGTEIGKMRMSKIDSDDIQKQIDQKSEQYSKSEVKKIYEIYSPCFRFAVAKNDIIRNPMLLVRLPLERNFAIKTKNIEYYKEEQVQVLLEETMDESYYLQNKRLYRYAPIYVLFLMTGLRLGEMCALRWSDVNNNLLNVDKSMVIVNNRGRYDSDKKTVEIESDTKTKAGKRKVPLNAIAKDALRLLKNRMVDFGISSDYVLHNYSGDHLSMSTVQKRWKEICCQIGLPCHGIHALRHTFASQLILEDVNIKTVSQLLGHANIQITYDRYIHIRKEQETKAVEVLENIYNKGNSLGISMGFDNYRTTESRNYA